MREIHDLHAFMEEMAEARRKADAAVLPWQAEVPEDGFAWRYWVPDGPGSIVDRPLTIYWSFAPSPYEEDREMLRGQPLLMGSAHSPECPEGEVGTLHRAEIWGVLTPEEWARCRELDWPQIPVSLVRPLRGAWATMPGNARGFPSPLALMGIR